MRLSLFVANDRRTMTMKTTRGFVSSATATCARRLASRGSERRGAVIVELALVVPFLAVMILGMCEVGQALRVEAVLAEAARQGCAAGCRAGGSNADIVSDVSSALLASGLPAGSASITVLVNGVMADAGTAQRNDTVTVQVSIPTSQTSVTNSTLFLGANSSQTEAITMLKQG
jgi:Flp pilus assembly protein TadG